MALLIITYKQCITCAWLAMLPWQDPPWTSVEFTGRSAELRNFGLLGEEAWVRGKSVDAWAGSFPAMLLQYGVGHFNGCFTTQSSHKNGCKLVGVSVVCRHVGVIQSVIKKHRTCAMPATIISLSYILPILFPYITNIHF